MTLSATEQARYEVREIGPKSPHFRSLVCWGVWDLVKKDYVRWSHGLREVRRFYIQKAAEMHRDHLHNSNADPTQVA
ncbi:hypothetical protein ACFP3U_15850 [Kitasatospora misakiensis]|uniref:Uncharacterized protein n=1 Tax=Kitasatospora misakiensis TaxID=67330 RepID=A0ABW0X1Q2_9ACTN